jgi:hypothetical protein
VDWERSSVLAEGHYLFVIPAGAIIDKAGTEREQYSFNVYLSYGTSGADTYSVQRVDASNVRVTRTFGTTAPVQYVIPAGTRNNVLYLTGGDGDDTMTVDYSAGDVPAVSVQADGGSGTDTLAYVGQSASTAFDVRSTGIAPYNTINYSSAIAVEKFSLATGTYTFLDDVRGKSIDIKPATTAVFNTTQRLGALSIAGAARVLAGGNKGILATDLAITGSGMLDLADNDLAINYAAGATSPLGSYSGSGYSGVTGLLARAYDFSAWDGPGLRSSMINARNGLTTLAPAEASEVLFLGATQTALWNGVTVDGTTVLVKYTYAGDANLDGVIDGGDYGVIDNFVQVPGASAYFNGDFNYDGVIDGGDYGIIDNNIQAQGGPL